MATRRQLQQSKTRLASQLAERAQGWLRERLLGTALKMLMDHEIRIQRWEAHMGAVADALAAYRAQVDAETTRIGEQLASQQARIGELQGRLDAGDAEIAAQISTELASTVDTLRAMGSGADADPLPDPDAVEDEPPAGGDGNA